MKKITGYKIVGFYSNGDLETEVNSLINNGWEPHGPVIVSDERAEYFMQAMVKKEPVPENKIVDIIILSKDNVEDLNKEAQDLVNRGYQPEVLVDADIDIEAWDSNEQYTMCFVKRISDVPKEDSNV